MINFDFDLSVLFLDVDAPHVMSYGVYSSQLIFCKSIYLVTVSLIVQMASPITKTCLYNFDPLKPHFYIVKLGFTGVYIIFLISAQNIDCSTR